MILNYLLILSSLAGLSLLTILFFQPRFLLSIATVMIPGVIYFSKTDQQLIALTIDDGPDPITTPKILEVLRRYGAYATFFIISSRVKDNEALIKDMVNSGHELGNHLTEDTPSIQLSTHEFESELLEADNILSKYADLRWLRPASGWHNTAMVKIAATHSYQVVLGSIFPFDTHISSAWFSSKHILANASPGSIIVLHDNGCRGERTALTLEKVLPELAKKGYRIVTLSDLFSMRNL